MVFRLQLSPAAREDLRAHRRWYRVRDRGLVAKFNAEIIAAIDTISDAPLRWAVWHDDGHRRFLLARFPYTVVYRVDDAQILVLAVLHQQQDAARRFPEDP